MKKIVFKISILAFLVVGFTSCDSELDQVPFDEFGNENAYASAADFENAVRGIYSGLTFGGLYGGSDAGGMLDAPDVLSDNVVTGQDGRGTRRTLHNWEYVASSGAMFGLYNAAYTTIYRANLLLENIGDFEGANKENVMAEAKALRALAHFNTVAFFGKIPTQAADANQSLGVAYVMHTDPEMAPARDNVGTVYDYIVADLKDALAGIESNGQNPAGRLNKEAVAILLSRVYLYMGKNDLAVQVINQNVSSLPAARANVEDVWVDESQDGLLFYIPNASPVLGIGVGVTWGQGSLTGLKPEFVVDYDFYQLFSNDDVRKDAYTIQARNNSSNRDFNAIKKLMGRGGQTDGVVDIKIIRAAEAYLNKAEALFPTDQTAARQALDVVRDRRYTSYAGGETGQALLNAIRLERRLEFAFESQRFFDLKRWGLPVERSGKGDLADGGGVPSDAQSLPAGSNKFQMPIWQTAIDINPNLQQNPGY